MQEKLLEVDAATASEIVWNIRRLLDAAAALGVPIAATEQYPDKLSPTVPELKERLGTCAGQAVLQRVRVRRDLRAAGGRTDGVSRAGVRHRNARVRDADGARPGGGRLAKSTWRSMPCGSRHAVDHETALRRMESAGVVLTTTEAAMFEWCRIGRTPEFKKISALAKEKPPTPMNRIPRKRLIFET